MNGLAGKVAIVTGASAGIGRATALALAAEGVTVSLADIDIERGPQVAREVVDRGGRAMFVPTNVADDQDVSALVATTVEAFGGLDLAFNNAGIEGDPAMTHECSLQNWQRTLAVNLGGAFFCMRHEIPRMLERGGGSIVNCASIAGLVGFPGVPAYVASKHGVVGITKTAALEYATQGIRVNAVCPGVIDTEMVARYTHGQPEAEQQLVAAEPMARMGRAEEIADAVVWLCSDRASFVTGQAIAIDGGAVAR